MSHAWIRHAALITLIMTTNWIVGSQTTPVSQCEDEMYSPGDGLSSQQRARKILLDADKHFSMYESYLCELKQLDQPVTTLADFLGDKKLSTWAVESMMEIDAPAAAPLLAQNAREPDREKIFKFYYALGLVNPMPWSSDLHRLALKELEAGRLSRSAIYVLGLTGDANDIPLLEQIYARETGYLRSPSEAALARLGSSFHLNNIEMELRATLRPETMKSDEFEHAVQATDAIDAAGFSGSERFVPLLCSHLYDDAAMSVDQLAIPANSAAQALSLIVDHKFLPPVVPQDDFRRWEMRCAEFNQ